MDITKEDDFRIRSLSDGVLYQEADRLTEEWSRMGWLENAALGKSQMYGLMDHAQNWSILINFVKHQKDRDWKRNDFYKEIYVGINDYLQQSIYQKVRGDWGFIPTNLTRTETKTKTEFFASILAREFIQHLIADVLWRSVRI